MRRPVLGVVMAGALATAGCLHVGPHAVRTTRVDYNMAIAQTNSEELLLNLVRLKYRDNPYFLSVERVASSLSLSSNVGVAADLEAGGVDTYSLGGLGVSYSESPTIFYTPLTGESFVRQLMSPINPQLLLLLYHSGWSIERIFLTTLQEVNGLRNAPTASGPTPAREPEFREFREATRALRSLQVRNLAEIGTVTTADGSYSELRIAERAREDADALTFKRLLGLDPRRDAFRLVAAVGGHDDTTITVQPRSMVAVLSYLSQAVAVPAADLQAGKVTSTVRPDGQPFDWQEMFTGLFRVESAPGRPADAAVAVRYRGSWFYIRDNDLDSKSTFSLLSQLVALQSGEVKTVAPMLSFSVGR